MIVHAIFAHFDMLVVSYSYVPYIGYPYGPQLKREVLGGQDRGAAQTSLNFN